MSDKIGSACWFQQLPSTEWKGGTILAWSLDNENGHMFPVAIIEEDKTGRVRSVWVERVTFSTPE